MNPTTNIVQCFWNQVSSRGDDVALHQKRGAGASASWKPLTWRGLGERVARMASALQKEGFKPGDKFAIYSDNCQEWIISDFAAMSAGLVSVPIYPNLTADQVRYIVEHSEAKAAFVRGQARLERIQGLTSLQKIITLDVTLTSSDPRVVSMDSFLSAGSPETAPHVSAMEKIDPKSLATISYTSGTTADPKGVMLSHTNIKAQIAALGTRMSRLPSDIVLSYLPLSHITERLSQFRHAEKGFIVYFGGGLDSLADDIKFVRPTVFMAVPRVYEKFQEAIQAKVTALPERRRTLFERTIQVGKTYLEQKEEGSSALGTKIRHKILSRLVGKKIRAGLGLDRCLRFFSGAAPLNPDTARFFYALGMPIVEGYGQTECAGASHINYVDRPAFGTVGTNLEGIECKLGPDGEILLRGDNVFMGYYKDPESTRETIRDGWLHTGDIGTFDGQGCLKITDRKKNIIVTSGGKNIAPAPIEAKIKQNPMISQVVVVGDRRNYLTALITLTPGHAPGDVKPKIKSHIDQINATLSSFETIKNFAIFERDFTVETGELTPTLKVKRGYIQEKYKAMIDGMYGP